MAAPFLFRMGFIMPFALIISICIITVFSMLTFVVSTVFA
jgi:hypothetical protein